MFILASGPNQKPDSPNIIFILTDDQGWAHVSHRAHPDVSNSINEYYETPVLDQMAKSGLMFTRGYAPNPICAPTRNSILFGQNAARHIYSNDEEWYKKTNNWPTIPKILKRSNPDYQTAHFGKWHIAMEPSEAGYDLHDGMPTNDGGEVFAQDYIDKGAYKKASNDYIKKHNPQNPYNMRKAGKPSLYWSDMNPKDMFGITQRATAFMKESIKKNKPFYVQLSHYATHLSLSSTSETLDYFANKEKGEYYRSPEFAAMLKDLDASIGMVLDFVKDAGIEDNTYIFLMGDNGGKVSLYQIAHLNENKELTEVRFSEESQRNYPLKKGKHSMYEGGLRVPFMVMGPGIQEGRVNHVPVSGLDLLPTFADLAGYDEPFSKVIDGKSLKSLLLDEKSTSPDRANPNFFFHQGSHREPKTAVISGDYKLIKRWERIDKITGKQEMELYNLSKDLGETTDLKGEMPDKVAELEAIIDDFIKETNTCTTRRDIRSAVYRVIADQSTEEKGD